MRVIAPRSRCRNSCCLSPIYEGLCAGIDPGQDIPAKQTETTTTSQKTILLKTHKRKCQILWLCFFTESLSEPEAIVLKWRKYLSCLL